MWVREGVAQLRRYAWGCMRGAMKVKERAQGGGMVREDAWGMQEMLCGSGKVHRRQHMLGKGMGSDIGWEMCAMCPFSSICSRQLWVGERVKDCQTGWEIVTEY